MTVYLIAQPTVSRTGELPKLQPLAKWGRVRVLINPGEDPRFNPARALGLIESRLKDFSASEDYLAWAGGDTLAAVLTGIVLADMSMETETDPGFTSFRWLRWERGHNGKERTDEGGCYVPITVELPNDDIVPAPDTFDPITTE